MENNIKSIHIELNGDSDTYSVEIVSTKDDTTKTINIPYVYFTNNIVEDLENGKFGSLLIKANAIVTFVKEVTPIKEETQNV